MKPLSRVLPAAVLAVAVAVPTQATAAARIVPAADHEVTFAVDGTTTHGTLHLPAHRPGHRLPAALLLPGSGPTDRDGNQPPALTPNTLAGLAAALGSDGVATLRFDKYGTGRTGLGAYTGRPEDLDHPAFVRQADAAYRLLSSRPQIDSHAVRLIGHSEGAMTALVVATTARPRPAGIAMLQPQAMRLLDVIARQLHDQLTGAAAAGQLTEEQKQAAILAVDRAVADFRAHRPVDTATLLPPIAALFQALEGVNRRFVASDDSVDPARVARRLPAGMPVLLTCGTADPQVPCDTTDALTTALRRAHTRGPGRVVLPGVGHSLDTSAAPGVLAPSVLAALRDLLRP
ncbi:alpha/beta hydrolase [Actinoplanes philippinensis]|uniref:Serine aminopeptidase S33 domain-containing protein n=1 Tax=Actinoplanes philippinensis TaxID=35752 RepID=A0A1I2MI04_9ACTN|nr:alpha/beta hydrolase [Actinoplanes philippinensis]GIE76352.1 alpha/beta hydrolase [Actinoplanes philippinensis]SFF89157.1 hypothetical protein SAMN05421541_12839 [Actinoplanes philippinensis]